jgi:hypothetical protein
MKWVHMDTAYEEDGDCVLCLLSYISLTYIYIQLFRLV